MAHKYYKYLTILLIIIFDDFDIWLLGSISVVYTFHKRIIS